MFRKRRTNHHSDEDGCNKCKVEAALSLSSFGSSDELQDEVAELNQNTKDIEKKDKDRRASTQVFSLRKVNRMNEFYKYEETKTYNFENVFEQNAKELERYHKMEEVYKSKEIEKYIPEADEIVFVDKDQTKRQRLIFYSSDFSFDDKEIQSVMNFKVWATMQGYKLPDTDEEILRNLYARNWDHQEAYDSLKFKISYQI